MPLASAAVLRSLGLFVGGVATAAAIATAAAAGGEPRVLVTERARIASVAQSADSLVWALEGAAVKVRHLSGGRPASFSPMGAHGRISVAISGSDALWSSHSIGNEVQSFVETASRSTRRKRVVLDLFAGMPSYESGRELGGIAAGGGTSLFSIVEMFVADPTTCDSQGYSCTVVYRGGSTWRIDRGIKRRIGRIPGAFVAAAYGPLVALVVPGTSRQRGRVIEVRATADGRLIRSISASAGVRALAMSRFLLAAIVGEDDAAPKRLLWYDLQTGTAKGSIPLSRTASDELSTSRGRVVFREGKRIKALDSRTGRARVVRTSTADIYSVSVNGDRLVWVETAAARSRILMQMLQG